MSLSLEIVICSVLFLLALAVFVVRSINKSTPSKGTGTDKPQDKEPMSDDPTIQDEILSKISKLENELRNLSKFNDELTGIKSQLNQQSSFAGSDVLFCPETDEPMRRINIAGEDIDVSQAGCWFDPGELLSILDRSEGFISKLHSIYKDSSVKMIEDSISKEKEIESRKKYVAHLYSEVIRTNNSAIQDKISLHNERIKYLIYGPPQVISHSNSGFSQSSISPTGQTIQSQQNTTASTASLDQKFTQSSILSNLKCPASNLPMTRINVEGIELDVSPYGVWFDGTENLGSPKPEILQVLEKKQNFFARLFGSQSLAKIIEQKTVDVSKKYELDNKKHESKKSIISQAINLSRTGPESAEFSRQLNQLKVVIKSFEDLG